MEDNLELNARRIADGNANPSAAPQQRQRNNRVKSNKARRGRDNRVPKWRQSKGPRPFDPASTKVEITLEEHIQRGLRVSEDALKHHRKVLDTEKNIQKRINHLNMGLTQHNKVRNRGEIPKDSARTIVVNDLKRQEILVLEAFKANNISKDSAVYLITEIHFLSKLLTGPAFYRSGLEEAQLTTIINATTEWATSFRTENAASEEDVAFSEATMRDIRSFKGWHQRTKNI